MLCEIDYDTIRNRPAARQRKDYRSTVGASGSTLAYDRSYDLHLISNDLMKFWVGIVRRDQGRRSTFGPR